MAEERFLKQRQEETTYGDLDERLSAYYGPPLPEQPLSASSWQQLHMQLGSQKRPRRRLALPRIPHIPRIHRLRRTRRTVPAYIHEGFFRIAYDAHVPLTRSMLFCTFKAGLRNPTVRVSPLGNGKIRLVLPLEAGLSMEPSMLDVLLASGIARLHYARKTVYMLNSLLSMGLALLAGVSLILLWLRHLPLVGLLIALGLWVIVGVLVHVRRHRLALQADALMVQWLGRAHACQGLHMLADRNRHIRLRRWGEPSLAERIARVCGTRVPVVDDRLTMVR